MDNRYSHPDRNRNRVRTANSSRYEDQHFQPPPSERLHEDDLYYRDTLHADAHREPLRHSIHVDPYLGSADDSHRVVMDAEYDRSFDYYDLEDFSRPKNNKAIAKLAFTTGIVASVALLGGMAISTIPELSPADIISMDGYVGQAEHKTPHNLKQIVGTADKKTFAPVSMTTDIIDAATTGNVDSSLEMSPLLEIPAVTVQSSTANIEATESTDLPIELRVSQQWSNVRNEPSTNGAILRSLDIGVTVKVLSKKGEWFEIFVPDSRGTIGFMHRSTLN